MWFMCECLIYMCGCIDICGLVGIDMCEHVVKGMCACLLCLCAYECVVRRCIRLRITLTTGVMQSIRSGTNTHGATTCVSNM